MIPGVLLLAPIYILMRELGLLSTYRALIIVYCTFAIPLCCFMLKGFFDAIPRELEDAAEMDGCSRLGFISRILLPLAAPGLLATALFCFVTAWNEFLFGYVLINDEARRTLTPGIMVFKGPHLTDWGALMAASVLAVVPVAIFFVYLQRFLMEGLLDRRGQRLTIPLAPPRIRANNSSIFFVRHSLSRAKPFEAQCSPIDLEALRRSRS